MLLTAAMAAAIMDIVAGMSGLAYMSVQDGGGRDGGHIPIIRIIIPRLRLSSNRHLRYTFNRLQPLRRKSHDTGTIVRNRADTILR